MKHDPFSPVPEGCEAAQRQLSDSADAGETLTPALQVHLRVCPECTRFADEWLDGPPEVLARPVPTVVDPELRARILDAAALPPVIRFPAPAGRPSSWPVWFGRAAACLALAGLTYWLLNPAATPVRQPATAASAPTLTQSLAQMEDRTKHEQAVVQTALVDGGREVRGNVEWTVSALEL